MKKLDEKIIEEEEELKLKKEDVQSPTSCNCCEALASSLSKTIELAQKNDHEEHHIETRYNFFNEKLLILIGLALTIPIVLLEMIVYPHSYYLLNLITLALATPVQIVLGRPFYIRFIRAIRDKKGFTTDTLVVISTTVAYFYSLVTMIIGSHVQFFEASSSVLTIFTVGDIVVTKPGEKIAADGQIVYGESSVDESMITGESIPVNKKIGDKVIGGTLNKNGYLQFKATTVGRSTVLASIIEMIKKAKMSKAPVQRIADRAVQYFIPIVLSIAIISSLYWLFIAHESVTFAITVFATILVVSCPCALGIATPLVISLGIDKAARKGILIKGGQYLEKLSSIDTIVFDKTGTLTNGRPEVTDIIPNKDYTEFELLQLAASAEIKSEHPIAQAIVRMASQLSIPMLNFSEFSSLTGNGVVASYFEKRIFVRNPRKSDDDNNGNNKMMIIIPETLQTKITDLESQGKTVVAVFTEDKLVGLIALADTLRENAKHVIDEIQHNMIKKKEIILMSGDNERTANAIAMKLGIKKVLAQVLPETKVLEIKKLKNQGKKIIMVGDGINDAPALTQADIGIAIGSGTDVALSSGHIILIKSDLRQIPYDLKIGEYSMKKIKQNLAMSFAYNIITISVAAGLFYGITNSLILTPTLAALGWVISDSAVFGNSLLIRKFVVHK